MKEPYRVRRIIVVLALLSCVAGFLIINPASYEKEIVSKEDNSEAIIETVDVAPEESSSTLATTVLEKLELKAAPQRPVTIAPSSMLAGPMSTAVRFAK